jgi:hypothetical protein
MTVVVALQDAVPTSLPADVTRRLHASDRPAPPGAPEGLEVGLTRPAAAARDALEPVATGPTRAAAATRLRGPYLDAIGALSRRNASPQWWATHLAAKHPYPSLFTRLCALAVADELLEDGMLVVCSTPALAAEVAGFAAARGLPVEHLTPPAWRARAGAAAFAAGWTAGRGFARVAPQPARRAIGRMHPTARFALDRTPGHRRRTLRALGHVPEPFAGDDTALLATWIDERSFDSDGGYRDPHFGPLADRLEAAGLRVALLPRVLPGADFAACAQRLLASGRQLVFPDAWLTEADWVRCERAAARYQPVIPADLAAGGVPFARLAQEYLHEHRRACADALSYHVLVRRLAEAGARPARVILPWEGHAWEHALTDAVQRRLEGSAVVGYDNLNFSRLALSLYPAAAELELRPLPDRVVTNGPAFARVLAGEGFPADRIRTGCALRHDGFARAPRAARGGDRALVAGSIDVPQTVELITAALAAFGERVVVKLHPACDAAAIRAACPSARYDDRPLGEQFPEAALLLYTYSSVVYDALAARVPPIFVRSEIYLDLDQLEPFPGLGWSARGPAELRAAAEEIAALAGEARAAWEQRAASAVDEALAPCGSDAVEPFL